PSGELDEGSDTLLLDEALEVRPLGTVSNHVEDQLPLPGERARRFEEHVRTLVRYESADEGDTERNSGPGLAPTPNAVRVDGVLGEIEQLVRPGDELRVGMERAGDDRGGAPARRAVARHERVRRSQVTQPLTFPMLRRAELARP